MAGKTEVVVNLSHESRVWIKSVTQDAVREISKALAPPAPTGTGVSLWPVTLESPEGTRYLFVDRESNESHWVLGDRFQAAGVREWRQCFTTEP